MNPTPELSVVIPVYNSATIFPELYHRLTKAITPVVESYEIITVLDGCSDNSFEVIQEFATKDKSIKIVEFARNFGHQSAITAGLELATGKMIAIMDDDLEDPPETLPAFVAKINEGYDVVYGVRKNRKRFFLYRFLYLAYYRFLGKVSKIDIPYDAGDFCVMRARVVNVLNKMEESNRYLRGLRAWCGFQQTGVVYSREQRFSGISGYSLKKYFSFALDGIFSFSYKPLHYVSTVGVLIALLSFITGTSLIVLKLLDKIVDVPGWASLAVSIFFLSGIQLVSIGVIGEYISRIYDEVKKRPKYIINRTIGITETDNDKP